MRFVKMGESCLVVEFGTTIDPAVNERVHSLAAAIAREKIEGIAETVPTYRSLAVYFDPFVISRRDLEARIALLAETGGDKAFPRARRVVEVPVLYGGEEGPDLDFVARHAGLSPEEVVKVHTSRPYPVYMLGFLPGFPYLGGMPESIAAPRLETPRTRIPAGSVGIAGSQTGFYPLESPGGWRIIGRTPLKAFDPASKRHFLFSPGESLHFRSVDADEYAEIRKAVEEGRYTPRETFPREVLE